MKWTEFRELSSDERKKRKGAVGPSRRSANRNFELLKARFPFLRGSTGKHPLLDRGIALASVYCIADSPERFATWAKLELPDETGRLCSAPILLLRAGNRYPELMFGFRKPDGEYVPGILTTFGMPWELYKDYLDEVLCEEDLSGRKIDEVVAMCGDRMPLVNGKPSRNPNRLVFQRVRDWDVKGKR